jgi:hypothetical protein
MQYFDPIVVDLALLDSHRCQGGSIPFRVIIFYQIHAQMMLARAHCNRKVRIALGGAGPSSVNSDAGFVTGIDELPS